MPRQPKPDPERLETLEQRLAKEQLDLRLAREKEQASLSDYRPQDHRRGFDAKTTRLKIPAPNSA